MPLNAGWAGAGLYLAAIALTLLLGLKQAFKRTPWQPLILIAFSAFLANVAEGLIIDTDHWRHFYLLMGVIWGAASVPSPYLATNGVHKLRGRIQVASIA